MIDPKWVTRRLVEYIHEGVIEIGGGAHGLRDAALLESALARPQNLHAYSETDIFELAASYAEGIARRVLIKIPLNPSTKSFSFCCHPIH